MRRTEPTKGAGVADMLFARWGLLAVRGMEADARDTARQLLVEVSIGNDPGWTDEEMARFAAFVRKMKTGKAITPDTTPRDNPAAEGAAAARRDELDRLSCDSLDRLLDRWNDAGGDWESGWEERDPDRLKFAKAAAGDLVEALGTDWDNWCHVHPEGYDFKDDFLGWCIKHGVIHGRPQFVVCTDRNQHSEDKTRVEIVARMGQSLCRAVASAIKDGDSERALGYLDNHRAFVADVLADLDRENGRKENG